MCAWAAVDPASLNWEAALGRQAGSLRGCGLERGTLALGYDPSQGY